jgi:hypothetical protein
MTNTTERTGTGTAGPLRGVGTSQSMPTPTVRCDPVTNFLRSLVYRRVDLGREFAQRGLNLFERQFVSTWPTTDQVQTRREGQLLQNCTRAPPKTVADDRVAHGAIDSERHLGSVQRGIDQMRTPKGFNSHSTTITTKPQKILPCTNPTDQADRRARPLSRRDFRTARPARVLMRARKPCFLDRRRALGW